MDISSADSANPDPVIDSSAKSITPPTESASTSAHKVEPQVGTSRIPDKGKGSMQPYVHRDSILRSIIQIVRTKEKDAINGLVIRSDIQQNLQSQSAVTEEEFEWDRFCVLLLTNLILLQECYHLSNRRGIPHQSLG